MVSGLTVLLRSRNGSRYYFCFYSKSAIAAGDQALLGGHVKMASVGPCEPKNTTKSPEEQHCRAQAVSLLCSFVPQQC